jgi:hypothetical protein
MAKDGMLGGRGTDSLRPLHCIVLQKMTLGWMFDNERHHAGRQGELIPRGHFVVLKQGV